MKVLNFTTATLAAGLLAMSAPMSADADVIAGWDTWNTSAALTYDAPITNGVTAQAVGTEAADGAGWGGWNEPGRSADGTWGTQALSPLPSTSIANSTDSVGLRNATSSGEMTITIENTSGSALDLESFHFDAISRFSDAPDEWSLSITSGSVTTGLVSSGTIENVNSFSSRAEEGYDIDLSGLADKTFENGESVVFELAFTGGVVNSTSGGHNMMLDNMAIVAVPEPGSLALLGLGGLLIARRRRG